MNLYRVEVPVWATAYIKAASPEEAVAKARDSIVNSELEAGENCTFDGRPFEEVMADEHAAITFSPMMTAMGDPETLIPGFTLEAEEADT